VGSVLSAPLTVLLYFQPVRSISFIFITTIISSLTISTFKCNYLSHLTTNY